MSIEEKLAVLEKIMELEKGELDANMALDDIDEWDSFAKLYLTIWVKKELKKRLTPEEVSEFKTVQDIIEYME